MKRDAKMKNKSIYIYNVIRSIIFVIILLWLFFNNTGLLKFIIIPFIICGLAVVGKNICLILNKKNYADILSKIYIITLMVFGIIFLIFWSYSVIKANNYFSLIFTIPFWILGIYMVRKFLFKSNKKYLNNKKGLKINFKIVISSFLVGITLLSGIIFLFIGVKETYKLNKTTKDYITTNGYFIDYDIYSRNKNGTTYKLIYNYEVNGKEYTVSTDYGNGNIPEKNSIRKVKYNPNNPSEAILLGTNSKNFLIYFGGFFTLGSIAFILVALQIRGVFDKIKINVIGFYFGFVFFIIGIGIILFQNGTTSSFLDTIKYLGLWIFIPILFIIVGMFQMIKCLFFKQLEFNKKTK